MERLTQYDEFGNADIVGIDNTKLYERLVCEEVVALTIATNKLAEFEDLMEEIGISDIPELKQILTTNAVWQENQALKDRWEKLKEFIKNEYQTNLKNNEMQGFCMLKLVEAQMQELEKED